MTLTVPALRARRAGRSTRSRPVGVVVSTCFLVVVAVLAAFASFLAPHSPEEMDRTRFFQSNAERVFRLA